MGRLHENMREQHSFLMRFMWTAARNIMSGFQGATCIVQSHPWCPDMLSIVNAMAEQHGELVAGQLIVGLPEQNRPSCALCVYGLMWSVASQLSCIVMAEQEGELHVALCMQAGVMLTVLHAQHSVMAS